MRGDPRPTRSRLRAVPDPHHPVEHTVDVIEIPTDGHLLFALQVDPAVDAREYGHALRTLQNAADELAPGRNACVALAGVTLDVLDDYALKQLGLQRIPGGDR